MATSVKSPIQELIKLRNRFEDLFERSMQGNLFGGTTDQQYWTPPIDAFERGEHLVVEVEIPGADPDSIELEFKDNRLSIQGNRPTASEQPVTFTRLERRSGPFRRIFHVHVAIDAEGIQAEYRNGLLVVTMPMRSGAGEKKITVTSA